MTKIKDSVNCCDISCVELTDVFPNPTKDQIELWNSEYGEQELDELMGRHHRILMIKVIRGMMLETLDTEHSILLDSLNDEVMS